MKSPHSHSMRIVVNLFVASSVSATDVVNRIDDGVLESVWGFEPAGAGGSLAFLNQLQAKAGKETISGVSIAWGKVRAGLPVQVYLWADPNQDGDPSDAVVLRSVSGVTFNPSQFVPEFTTYDFPDWTFTIGEKFFVGAIVVHVGNEKPAWADEDGLDDITCSATCAQCCRPPGSRSWAAGARPPLLIDPNNLNQMGANRAPVDLVQNQAGLMPLNWAVRAIVGRGACCLAFGGCTVSTGNSCTLGGGTYKGDGTNCDDNNGNGVADVCESGAPFPGPCCLPTGGCVDFVPLSDCTLAGGTPQGAGNFCPFLSCPWPFYFVPPFMDPLAAAGASPVIQAKPGEGPLDFEIFFANPPDLVRTVEAAFSCTAAGGSAGTVSYIPGTMAIDITNPQYFIQCLNPAVTLFGLDEFCTPEVAITVLGFPIGQGCDVSAFSPTPGVAYVGEFGLQVSADACGTFTLDWIAPGLGTAVGDPFGTPIPDMEARSFTIEVTPENHNDDCFQPLPISDGATAFCTHLALTDGPAHPSCAAFAVGDKQVHRDVWYEYDATCTGQLAISTCDPNSFDTRIAVYRAGIGCFPNLLEDCHLLACNDDAPSGVGCQVFHSELTAPVISGKTYLIRVGGFSSIDFGPGTLTLTCNSAASPEACCLGGGDCVDVDSPFCQLLGGTPLGPGNLCRGDCDLNGVDDACELCTSPANCFDGDVCTCDLCLPTGFCANPPKPSGDLDCNGSINIFDVFCLLDGLSGSFVNCSPTDVDFTSGPAPCVPDGFVNIFDLFALLDALSGIDPCCP